VLITLGFCLTAAAYAKTWILVDDFNSAKPANTLNGGSGCWTMDPQDTVQYIRSSFDKDVKLGNSGCSLRVDYNIDTARTYGQGNPNTNPRDFGKQENPNMTMNGYYTLLSDLNLSNFKYLVFYVKGNPKEGYTKTLTVEMKNGKQQGRYVLEGIGDDWHECVLPLAVFKDISDWSSMTELVFTFDSNVTRKSGSINIDFIYFTNMPEPLNAKTVKLPKDRKICVGGRMLEWGGIQKFWLDNEKNVEWESGTHLADFSAYSQFAWDDECLYFASEVNDKEVVCKETGRNIDKFDCVELCIDPTGNGFTWNDPSCFRIGFAPSGPDNAYHCWSWFQNSDPTKDNSVEMAATVDDKKGRYTYYVEAAIKWKFLGIKPEKGKVIGISFAVHDYDNINGHQAKLNYCYMPQEGGKVSLAKMKLK